MAQGGTRRRYAHDPEGRAQALQDQSYMASGQSYISGTLEGVAVKIPYCRNTPKTLCDHAFAMCGQWQCLESWTMDYKIDLHRTIAGRDLATKLRIDPVTDLHGEHQRIGLYLLKHEDYVIEEGLDA